jgi:formate dehydrogenase maturation protein FdhE
MQAATARQLLDVLRHPAPAITAEIERLRGGIHEELLASVRAVLADQFNLVVTPDHVPVWDDLTTLLIAHR